MTREEAERACERLATEHPDRATHHWLAQEVSDGEWRIVKLPGAPRKPFRAGVEGQSPQTQSDPRTGPLRDVPPFGAG